MAIIFSKNIMAITGFCAAMLFASPSAAAPAQADIDAYRDLIKQDLRLATAGYRLAATNSPYCRIKERNPGWVIHDIAQYPDAEIAKAAFGFRAPIHVAAVVQNGPADQAGVEPDDGFSEMDNATIYWPAMPLGKTGYERMASFKQLLHERLNEKAALPLRLSRAKATYSTTLLPPLVCASDFQIDTNKGINAGADGKMVSVSLALMEFAKENDELAAIVAHEFAHNMLQHRARLKSAKVKRGIAGQFGKSKDAVRATETEADLLSVWLIGNAGYDINAAINFLERFGNGPGKMLIPDRTHLSWKSRVEMMRQEAVRYSNAPKNQQGKATPPLLTEREAK